VPRVGKYARSEHERRFLVATPPELAGAEVLDIVDRYLVGTRLRLRVMTARAGAEPVRKLTQKLPATEGAPALITTIYLSAAEHGVLASLPGAELYKARYRVPPLVVDVFAPPLAGLVLAEAEFETGEELARFERPEFAVAEVTGDERFTGGRLATASRAELAAALEEFGVSLAPARAR
jgi:CYTH domain-containing protein